jgi:hypothetical protein
MGFKLREQKIGDGGAIVGSWLSVSALVHEIGLMRDGTGSSGRFHHVAYWYGAPQHLLDIADIFSERDIRIESGPAKHGTTQAYFLYCFEPGGNRIELFGDTGYLIFDPDWKTLCDVAKDRFKKAVSGSAAGWQNRSIAMARRWCQVIVSKRSDGKDFRWSRRTPASHVIAM